MKLLNNNMYLLLIDEVNGFKRGDWNYEIDNNIPIYQFDYDIGQYPGNKIIAYYPRTEEAKELNLPLLPNPFEKKIDIVALAIEKYGDNYGGIDQIDAFKEGYKAAQQSNKQYSLEDIKKAIEMARSSNNHLVTFEDFVTPDYTEEEIIQSLSTQQLPSKFIPEYNVHMEAMDMPRIHIQKEVKTLKTITNPEGKEEIVGKYQY